MASAAKVILRNNIGRSDASNNCDRLRIFQKIFYNYIVCDCFYLSLFVINYFSALYFVSSTINMF
ncbi:hypothetical protein NC652_030835 [Populus alba x Populus x berolinensis]|nr:hypothetical protein NC652_030835 [Populus alba x Populus x berolinensis]